MKDLEDDRKCWRLINGVLVEKKKKDVVPDINVNIDNMKAVLENMDKKAARCKEEQAKIEAE